jgi:VanZ family protein
MRLASYQINLFRAALVGVLVLISVLAVIPLQQTVVGDINDKLSHALAFYTLALLLDFSFPGSHYDLKKILPLLAYGLLIEAAQSQIPYRMFSLLDLGADALGLVAYGLSLPLMRHLPVLRRRWLGA